MFFFHLIKFNLNTTMTILVLLFFISFKNYIFISSHPLIELFGNNIGVLIKKLYFV